MSHATMARQQGKYEIESDICADEIFIDVTMIKTRITMHNVW